MLKPMEPKKPFYIQGEEPQAESEFDDPMARERYEAEHLSKAGLSGSLGAPHDYPVGPCSQEEYDRQVELQEKIRAQRGGLPDSSPEMPPQATSSKPFKF